MRKIKIFALIVVVCILCTILSMFFVGCKKKVDPTYIDESQLYYNPESYYGLYFYGPNHTYEQEDMIRSSKNMSTEYFDPSKPTIIWVHGWEPTYSYTDRILSTSSDYKRIAGIDEVEMFSNQLKEKYNVATFQYQLEVNGNGGGIGGNLFNIYRSAFINAEKTGYSMGYMFASELCMNLGGSYNQEIIYVGHSCGAFVTTAVNYYIQYFLDNKIVNNTHLLASRMALVDPYFTDGGDSLEGKTIKFTNEKIQQGKTAHLISIIDSLVEKRDVAVDVYLAMKMASRGIYTSSGLTKEEYDRFAQNAAIVKMEGLRSRYGDNNIHVLTRDWVFLSATREKVMDDKNQAGPSLAMSTAEIKALRGVQYKQNYKGVDVEKDSFTRVDTHYEG